MGHLEASSVPPVPAHNGGVALSAPGTVGDTPGSCSEMSPKTRTWIMSEAAGAQLQAESATGVDVQVGKTRNGRGTGPGLRAHSARCWEQRGSVCK